MIDKRYYEKLGGFAYLLGELRKKLGREQTDVLVNDAVTLCNELCDKYQGLSKKEKLHTERMIFPRCNLSANGQIHSAGRTHRLDGGIRQDRCGA